MNIPTELIIKIIRFLLLNKHTVINSEVAQRKEVLNKARAGFQDIFKYRLVSKSWDCLVKEELEKMMNVTLYTKRKVYFGNSKFNFNADYLHCTVEEYDPDGNMVYKNFVSDIVRLIFAPNCISFERVKICCARIQHWHKQLINYISKFIRKNPLAKSNVKHLSFGECGNFMFGHDWDDLKMIDLPTFIPCLYDTIKSVSNNSSFNIIEPFYCYRSCHGVNVETAMFGAQFIDKLLDRKMHSTITCCSCLREISIAGTCVTCLGLRECDRTHYSEAARHCGSVFCKGCAVESDCPNP
jgi:hypothetical protein